MCKMHLELSWLTVNALHQIQSKLVINAAPLQLCSRKLRGICACLPRPLTAVERIAHSILPLFFRQDFQVTCSHLHFFTSFRLRLLFFLFSHILCHVSHLALISLIQRASEYFTRMATRQKTAADSSSLFPVLGLYPLWQRLLDLDKR